MLRPVLYSAVFAIAAVAHAGDEGVTPELIRLGASASLSGPLGPQTAEYGAGARLYFDAVNANGGVHGRKIVYQTRDDAYDVQRAVENTRRLIEDEKVFIIFNSTGTAHTAAILPILESTQTVAFGPVTGASVFRDTVNPRLFHVRASYASEARAIVAQLRRTGFQRAAVFYQDDPFGNALLQEVRRAAEAEGLKTVVPVRVDPRQPDFAAAARQVAELRAEAVVIGSAGTTFTNFVQAVRGTASNPVFYGFSVASLDVINRELGSGARGIVLAQIMPSLRDPTVPVVIEYLKLVRERTPSAPPSASQFEGFVHARLLVEGLRRAGPRLSTAAFVQAMEAIGEIRFGRFVARYSPQSHNGSNYVELAIIDSEGRLRY